MLKVVHGQRVISCEGKVMVCVLGGGVRGVWSGGAWLGPLRRPPWLTSSTITMRKYRESCFSTSCNTGVRSAWRRARWPRYPPPTQITVSSPRCSRNLATIWSSTLYVFSARSDRYPAPAALSGAGQRLSPGHSRPIGGGALGSTSHHFTSYAFLTNDKFAQRLITDDTVSRVHMCGCTCVYCCWCLLSLRSESAV